MNPSGEVADIASPQSRKPLLKVAVLVIAGSLLIIGGALLIKQNTQKTQSPFVASDSTESIGPVAESANAKALNQAELLDQDIRLVFDSKKYPNIIKNAGLALKEVDGDKAYQYYQKVFQEMTKVYNQTKNIKQRDVMLELKNYAKGNPAYQESDWPVPL